MDVLSPLVSQLDATLLSALEGPASTGSVSLPLQGAGRVSQPNPLSLDLGRIVNAQVIQPVGDGRALVDVAGQAFDLHLPVTVVAGQQLTLQVSRPNPTLEFRLVSEAGGDTFAANTTVTLSNAAVARGPQDGPGSQSALVQRPLVALSPEDAPLGEMAPRLAQALQQLLARQPGASDGATTTGIPGTPDHAGDTALSGALRAPLANPPASQTPSPAADSARGAPGDLPHLATPPIGSASLATGSTLPSVTPERGVLPSQVLAASTTGNASAGASPSLAASANPGLLQVMIWPGQLAELEIAPDGQASPMLDPGMNRWKARLTLTLPHCGTLQAQLSWSTAGASVTVTSPDEASVATLRAASPVLVQTLTSLGLRLTALRVQHG